MLADACRAAGALVMPFTPFHGIAFFSRSVARAARSSGQGSPRRGPQSVDRRDAAATLVFDADRFEQLLEIAGPRVAKELLSRLENDLSRVRHGLLAGLARQSAVDLRAQTHVLVALAGAVGALRLQDLAERLNAAAHGTDPNQIARLGQQTLYLLDHLIDVVVLQTLEHDRLTAQDGDRAQGPKTPGEAGGPTPGDATAPSQTLLPTAARATDEP